MSACHPLNRTSPSDRRAMRSDPSRVLDAALTASLRLERHGSTRSDSCVRRAQPSQPTSRRCSYPTDSPSELTRAEGEDRPADLILHFFSAAVPPARPGPQASRRLLHCARVPRLGATTLRLCMCPVCALYAALHGALHGAHMSELNLPRCVPYDACVRDRHTHGGDQLSCWKQRCSGRGQSNQSVLRAHISPPNLSSA